MTDDGGADVQAEMAEVQDATMHTTMNENTNKPANQPGRPG